MGSTQSTWGVSLTSSSTSWLSSSSDMSPLVSCLLLVLASVVNSGVVDPQDQLSGNGDLWKRSANRWCGNILCLVGVEGKRREVRQPLQQLTDVKRRKRGCDMSCCGYRIGIGYRIGCCPICECFLRFCY